MNEDRKPLSPYVGAPAAPAHSLGGESPNLLEPLHAITSRPVQPAATLTAADLHNVQHLLPILIKASPQLAPKPSTPPPHPTVAQVLTAIPFGFKMAYQQLQSPTPYGNQIAAYKIYKNTTANNFSGATLWETRPHDNAINQKVVTLQDSTAGGGQNWYYFLTAVDSAGLESSPVAFQAGAITSQNANPNIAVTSSGSASQITNQTPFVDLTGITITIPTKGHSVLILFTCEIDNNTANSQVTFHLLKDGSQIGPTVAGNSSAANGVFTVALTFVETPSAASHTYKIQWNCPSGTATAHTGASLQVIELG